MGPRMRTPDQTLGVVDALRLLEVLDVPAGQWVVLSSDPLDLLEVLDVLEVLDGLEVLDVLEVVMVVLKVLVVVVLDVVVEVLEELGVLEERELEVVMGSGQGFCQAVTAAVASSTMR